MRERRRRHTRERRQIAAIGEILRGGGELVCSPGMFAAAERISTDVGTFGGVRVRSSNIMPPGWIVAMRKDDSFVGDSYRYRPIDFE